MAQSDTARPNSPALGTARGLVLREILTMGLESLRADKLRATMTALSMAVGTAALILVVTIALTGRTYVLAQIEKRRHKCCLGGILRHFQRSVQCGLG
jgi:hypothetical protein